jgi:hypothetical protein
MITHCSTPMVTMAAAACAHMAGSNKCLQGQHNAVAKPPGARNKGPILELTCRLLQLAQCGPPYATLQGTPRWY